MNKKYFEPGAAAAWARIFEGPDREAVRKRHEVVDALALRPGMVVADVGAGSGLFTPLLSKAVGDEGMVYAIDIVPSFVAKIEEKVSRLGLRNVRSVLGTDKATGLPDASIDLAFLCDVYHHLEYPRTYLASIRRSLRPGGVLVVMDFERIEGVSNAWILEHVRAGKRDVSAEIAGAGFELVLEHGGLLEDNYLLSWRVSER